MFKDNDFLQSDEWIRFQKSVGNRTHQISDGRFDLNIIEHVLPIAGRYFYVPRMGHSNDSTVSKLIDLAEKERTGWIRIDVPGEDDLKLIKKNIKNKIAKAPHDMQPREIFMIDISKSEEEILSDMKPKTRYNIRLASKKGVSIKKGKIYINDFLRLTKLTSERQGISAHPENYYRKMLEIPQVELYIAEYDGKVIASGIISFYGDTAIYLHGASDNDYRNVMATFALQWQAISDAKERGCKFYDFGGISTNYESDTNVRITNDKKELNKKWSGITRFKLGFSKSAKPLYFMGSYDIVISPLRYFSYRLLQKIKSFFKRR